MADKDVEGCGVLTCTHILLGKDDGRGEGGYNFVLMCKLRREQESARPLLPGTSLTYPVPSPHSLPSPHTNILPPFTTHQHTPSLHHTPTHSLPSPPLTHPNRHFPRMQVCHVIIFKYRHQLTYTQQGSPALQHPFTHLTPTYMTPKVHSPPPLPALRTRYTQAPGTQAAPLMVGRQPPRSASRPANELIHL